MKLLSLEKVIKRITTRYKAARSSLLPEKKRNGRRKKKKTGGLSVLCYLTGRAGV